VACVPAAILQDKPEHDLQGNAGRAASDSFLQQPAEPSMAQRLRAKLERLILLFFVPLLRRASLKVRQVPCRALIAVQWWCRAMQTPPDQEEEIKSGQPSAFSRDFIPRQDANRLAFDQTPRMLHAGKDSYSHFEQGMGALVPRHDAERVAFDYTPRGVRHAGKDTHSQIAFSQGALVPQETHSPERRLGKKIQSQASRGNGFSGGGFVADDGFGYGRVVDPRDVVGARNSSSAALAAAAAAASTASRQPMQHAGDSLSTVNMRSS